LTYVVGTSIILSAIIVYFTNQFRFWKIDIKKICHIINN
jgi:hypothetical protein